MNWRLIKAPLFVIDYLIVHELIHSLVMNHIHKFWTLLRSYYPVYRDAINWLNKYGNSL
ncbi:M48 family metallopeptidase [Sphingobacterium sp. DR205]|nr:M48 family metallopeptidase [Sphingobacterium sp. DR205]